MNNRLTWWKCSCGERLQLSNEEIESTTKACPTCGALVCSPQSGTSTPSTADTQMVNIRDMARMAQEGIDVGVSGEWDTSEPYGSESQPERDK